MTKQCQLVRKKKRYNVKSENTKTSFKTFNHPLDEIQHWRVLNRLKFTFCTLDRRKSSSFKNSPINNAAKRNKPSRRRHWKSDLSTSCCPETVKEHKTSNSCDKKTKKNNLQLLCNNDNKTDLCMSVSACVESMDRTPKADTLGVVLRNKQKKKKCREERQFVSLPYSENMGAEFQV